MKMIVGLGHRRQMGKDTFGNMLRDSLYKRGASASCVAFSDTLYHAGQIFYGWAGFKSKDYYDWHPQEKMSVLPEVGKSPREILIEMGIWARQICPTTLRECLLHREAAPVDVMIITDVREWNEVEWLQELRKTPPTQTLIMKVERPGVELFGDKLDSALDSFDGWDEIIHNSGSLADLEDLAYKLAYEICLRLEA